METQRERLVPRGGGSGGGDEILLSYCLLVAEFAVFILNRVGLFYLIFQYQYPDSSIISFFIYLATELMESVYLSEIGHEPIFTHRIHAFAGRSIFWMERFVPLLAATYFQSGKCRTLAALLFCFTNAVFIVKFAQWIYESFVGGACSCVSSLIISLLIVTIFRFYHMKDETQPKQEQLKGGVVENNLEEKVEPNHEQVKVEIVEEEKLIKEKVESVQESLEGEIVEEDKLSKERVEVDQEPLGAEIVEEDKLAKEKVELNQEPLEGEIVQVIQEPSETEITEEAELPEEVELDQEVLKFTMLNDELLKLELDRCLVKDCDKLVKEPKEEPLKAYLEDKSPPLKEANGERNEDLLEPNNIYEDDDDDEDEDSDEDDEDGDKDEDSTDDDDSDEDEDDDDNDEDNDSDDDNDDEDDDEEGEDDEEEEEEEYEYPKLKATDCYEFSTEVEFENRFQSQLIIDYIEVTEQCLNLEEEKKVLTAKLAAASESLEQYLEKEKDYIEDRNNWLIEKLNLSLKLDDAQTAYSQAKDDASKASLSSTVMQEELVRELSEISSRYQNFQLHCFEMLAENNRLSSQLYSANSSTECQKACLEDYENESRKLREERDDLSAKLSAETSYAEYYHKLFQEMEEKNTKLEEEKNDLAAKLCAAKALAELYRSYLHDCGL